MVVRVGSRPAGKAKNRVNQRPRVRDTADDVLVPDSRMKLPHERDETPNAAAQTPGKAGSPDAAARQAYRDASGAQKDTDLRGTATKNFRNASGTRAITGTPSLKRRITRHSPT